MTMMPPVAVLAGGLATRMGDATRQTPKSMLEVAGEPFIAHQLRLFRRENISDVVLCVGHLFEQIRDFVGDGANFGLNVQYSVDGSKLLGTGGALRKALPLLGPVFLVTYGDSYLDIPFSPVVDAFIESGRPALITVLHNEGRWDTSNVEFAQKRLLHYSKVQTPAMAHIDYGLSVLSTTVFDRIARDEAFDLASLYAQLVEDGSMSGYEVFNRFYEIGSHAGRAETESYIEARQ